jgi:hypothetical protein
MAVMLCTSSLAAMWLIECVVSARTQRSGIWSSSMNDMHCIYNTRRLENYYDVDRYIHIVRATPENENSMIILEASGMNGTVLMIGAFMASWRFVVEILEV